MLKNLLSQIWQRAPSIVRRWTIRFTNARFTVTAAAVIFNEQGEVLLLKHFFRVGSGWGLPGGFLQAGEQPLDALRRELNEEIGLDIKDVEILWARSFKRPRQIEILFVCRSAGSAKPQSMEVERAGWFAVHSLPPGLPKDQQALIWRAVEKRGG